MTQLLQFFLYRMKRFKKSFAAPALTIQYPFVKRKSQMLSRNSLRLELRECTGCLKCEKVCPVGAVAIQSREFVDELVLPTSSNGYLFERQVVQLKVDYGKCIFCGICVDECLPNALLISKEFPPVSVRGDELIDSLVKTKELPKMAWRKD